MRRLLIAFLLLSAPATAQEFQRVATDPTNDKFTNLVGTAALSGRNISFLVSHRPGEERFTHGYLLFPGSPGYGNLGVDNGAWRYNQKGNFLVRARRHFIDTGALTVVIDAPSDRQKEFLYSYRASPRYGEDVRAVADMVHRRFGALDWTFVGTSEGTVSAIHAARMLGGEVAKRLVLTSSLVSGEGKQGPRLSEADVAKVSLPVLWVHHRDDPCWATRYATAKSIAEKLKQPLITVAGAEDARGAPCEARSQHGFAGREIAVVRAIRAWVTSGVVAQRVDTP